MDLPTIGERDLMPVFSEEDNKAVKTLGMAAAGLIVIQIIVAVYVNG